MRVPYLVPLLAHTASTAASEAAAAAAEKTEFTFSEYYGDVCKSKSKSYSWTGAVPLSATEKELDKPLNTYRGARFDDGDVIAIKSVCDFEGINCDGVDSDSPQRKEKELFKRTELSKKDQELTGSSYLLSANMDVIAFRTKYERQWRHSYKASYALFTTKYWSGDTPKFIGNVENVWYFAFEPSPRVLDINDASRRKYLFVDENKNINYGEVGPEAELIDSVLPLGGDATAENGIFNGVPDWVYEEEMLASRSASWWSPNGDNIIFVKFNTKAEENVEYNYYAPSPDQEKRADDFVVKNNEDRYPQVERIPYSKPGGAIASYQVVFCSGLVNSRLRTPSCKIIEEIENLENKDLFVSVSFTNDVHLDQSNKDIKSLFYITTQNRIGSASSYIECYYAGELVCKAADALSETTDSTGWIDSGRVMNDPFKSQNWLFRIAYKQNDCNELQAYNKGTQVTKSLIDGEGVCIQSVQSIGRPINQGDTLTTDNSIRFYASVKGKSWERHVYQISYDGIDSDQWMPIKYSDWECLTCKTFDSRPCTYGGLSLAADRQFGMFSCSGPDAPYYLNIYMPSDGEAIVPGVDDEKKYPFVVNTTEVNQALIDELAGKKWPSVTYGTYDSGLFDMEYNFELYIPDGVDLTLAKESSLPLLIEIYGGPGSTKVKSSWKRSYTQSYMASKHNIIVAAVDGRGSGLKGQFEREDVSNFAAYLMRQYPALDSSRVGIWGWSFGGYATTHTLLYPGTVFTTGVAVAPLVSRFNYDSMHTERFMAMPSDNWDNYLKCSLLEQNITQMHDKQYTIISGTMDDNVHFQNAAQISKALFKENVQFNAMFYGDEAHSIRYGRGNNRHIYRVITRQFLKYFGLDDTEKDTWNV